MVVLTAQWCCRWKSCWVGGLGGIWIVSGVGLPCVILVFGLALSLAFLVFVTGSWRISSVACLKVLLLRICMAMVHEKVSQASLTLARR